MYTCRNKSMCCSSSFNYCPKSWLLSQVLVPGEWLWWPNQVPQRGDPAVWGVWHGWFSACWPCLLTATGCGARRFCGPVPGHSTIACAFVAEVACVCAFLLDAVCIFKLDKDKVWCWPEEWQQDAVASQPASTHRGSCHQSCELLPVWCLGCLLFSEEGQVFGNRTCWFPDCKMLLSLSMMMMMKKMKMLLPLLLLMLMLFMLFMLFMLLLAFLLVICWRCWWWCCWWCCKWFW